ncbi:helix-turn-helix transcriptional regulator [Amycolatopsis sp. OK19-0408]|uniref:Helix-turn-helix transcriptional regulator n=1 Tax=Amycolatopsis iheyensis TaxID=2945988 RepID=A0A9X2SJ16_9PSEU|nr:helix-turn-helix transcriptional regulator [Amycolatopsis iheyensis]MCR6484312.1 helix-turn-helix transcriptional regulator [Amycolatopsis iheyensis]
MASRLATPRARALGFGLRAARDTRGFGLRQLARMVGVTPQELSHWEVGTRIPTVAQVGLLLGAMRVEPVERKRLLSLAENAREPNWVELARAPEVAAFVEYERAASTVINWEPLLVPGILQTGEYTEALFAEADGLNPGTVEDCVAIRARRRELLRGQDPLNYIVFVGEGALRGGLARPRPMSGQLTHLVSMSEWTNVSIRVLPMSLGFHPGLFGPFAILDFWNLPSIVHLEGYCGSSYLYDDREVAAYRAAAGRMRKLALSEDESRAFIQGVIADLEA